MEMKVTLLLYLGTQGPFLLVKTFYYPIDVTHDLSGRDAYFAPGAVNPRSFSLT